VLVPGVETTSAPENFNVALLSLPGRKGPNVKITWRLAGEMRTVPDL
jgi:hypothetical protein